MRIICEGCSHVRRVYFAAMDSARESWNVSCPVVCGHDVCVAICWTVRSRVNDIFCKCDFCSIFVAEGERVKRFS